jgi:putative phosphoesterase
VKLGLISDIHGDPVSLELAWAHLTVLKADRIVCAGDVVGYGPFPDRVAAFLAEHKIDSVRGNHDRWALERGPGIADEFGGATPSDSTLDYLRQLRSDLLLSEQGKIGVVVHGSPRSDMEYVTPWSHPPAVLEVLLHELRADFLVVGHTHIPMWYRCDHGLVVNPGSVVAKPYVNTSQTFALVDLDALSVTFHDVETGAEVGVEPWTEDDDEPDPALGRA